LAEHGAPTGRGRHESGASSGETPLGDRLGERHDPTPIVGCRVFDIDEDGPIKIDRSESLSKDLGKPGIQLADAIDYDDGLVPSALLWREVHSSSAVSVACDALRRTVSSSTSGIERANTIPHNRRTMS